MTDITVDLNGYRVNLRVAAIVTRGAEVLLCRPCDQDWWYLPGGRIKTNESSSTAIQRELTEEIGAGFKVIRPMITAENFFDLEGQCFHEMSIYYEVAWSKGEIQGTQKGIDEVFEWIPRERLCEIVLKPDFIKEHILNPSPDFELVIHRDGG
ncbi:MAG: NUDIX domain-containing protein [Planctomycetes bacterium]|nr:NUDIX domain-containing protein [Planctomycetota bacterium]MCH9724162.1 NUDIX domain-containing protein [Planctomycetota bacterium]MCH9777945.1 NUDIX domain-containing protein [Planctomycetota bacterium]MCH9789308.1 NUDIX domain-containing protein [Planctomycetota bacterium]